MLKNIFNENKNKKLISVPLREVYTNSYLEVDSLKRVITHYITSNEPNRYNQVVNIAGYDDTDYRKNPIVLFNHGDMDMLGTLGASDILEFVIGRNLWIVPENNLLKVKTELSNSELASDIFELYSNKILTSWSKNFYPITEPRYENGFIYYDKWGMYEYSSCVIPVDTNSITLDVTIESAIQSVKNKYLKNALSKSFIKNKIETDEETVKLLSDIEIIKNEFKEIKNKLSVMKSETEIEKERNQAIKNAIESYNQVMSNKILEIVGNVNNIAETVKDMPALVTNCVAGAIRKAQGKLD